MKKICKACNLEKAIEEFGYSYKEKGYRTSECKKCRARYTREYKKKLGPIKLAKIKRNDALKANYGITLEDYDQMYLKQEGKCVICYRFQSVLNVDHCHDTLKIRGLLCDNCNKGLGCFKDKTIVLENAIKYLKESETDKS